MESSAAKGLRISRNIGVAILALAVLVFVGFGTDPASVLVMLSAPFFLAALFFHWIDSLPDEDSKEKRDRIFNLVADRNSQGCYFTMTYRAANGKITRRDIKLIECKSIGDGRFMLITYCLLRQAERHFRVDRIIDIKEMEMLEPLKQKAGD